jgi:hypothetical protein
LGSSEVAQFGRVHSGMQTLTSAGVINLAVTVGVKNAFGPGAALPRFLLIRC